MRSFIIAVNGIFIWMFECLTGLKCFVQCLKYRDKILFIIIVVITVTVTVSVAIPNDAFPLGSHSLSFVHSTGLQLQRTDYYYICMCSSVTETEKDFLHSARCNWMNDDCYWWHVDIAASLHFITARWWIDMLCFIAGWLVRLRVYIVFIGCCWWGSSIHTQTIAHNITTTAVSACIDSATSVTDTHPYCTHTHPYCTHTHSHTQTSTHTHTHVYNTPINEQVAHKL